jgi:ribosomal protein L37AE/L43A
MRFPHAETKCITNPGETIQEFYRRVGEWQGPIPPNDKISTRAIAFAVVHHGRWIVHCPWCSSAQFAPFEDRRFFCVECGNMLVGGAYVPVRWPEDIQSIEIILEKRLPQNRNWNPGETTEQLVKENLEHQTRVLEMP